MLRAILTNGTTAEFPSLTLEERIALVEYCRKVFKGIILNNISSCCLTDSFKLIKHSSYYADALVVLQSELPVFLYHFPKHTQNSITPKMVEILLNKGYKHLVGIKDSQANIETSLKFKALKAGHFQVFVGSDRLALETLKSGLDGSVTGGGNAFPEFLMSIYRYFDANNLEMAQATQNAFDNWNRFRKQNHLLGEIVITKIALQTRLKHFPTFVRLPMQTATSEVSENIGSFVKHFISFTKKNFQ